MNARSPLRPRLLGVLLAVLAGLAFVQGAWAQEASPSAEAETPPEPETIAAAELVARAAELERSLRELSERAEPAPAVEAIARRLAEVEGMWRQEAADASLRLQREVTSTLVVETERIWSDRQDRIVGWHDLLGKRASAFAQDLELLDGQRGLWERTRDAVRKDDLPPALRETIARMLKAIEAMSGRIRDRRNDVLALQSAILEQQQRVADVLAAAREARERTRSQLAARDSPTLWRALAQARPADARGRIRAAWQEWVGALRVYLSDRTEDLALLAFALAALVGGIALLGRRAARWAAKDEAAAATARALGRPVSAALLVLLLAYPAVLPGAPLLARWMAGVVVLIPALRLIAPLLEGPGRRAVYWLSGWYAVDALRLLLAPVPVLERILLLLEAAAAAAFVVWLLRPRRLAALQVSGQGLRLIRVLGAVARIALVLLVVSLLSNLVGNTSLAAVLVEGTLRGAYAAVLLGGSALVLESLWAALLHTRLLSHLRGVRHHEALLRRRGATLVGWGLAFIWLWIALVAFQVSEPVWEGALALLAAHWPIGDLELSLGDLAAFAFTVWVAIWLSRFVRFVLDEDVLPRAELPRGVPYAISSGVHYVILLFGFLLAISAAGFDMSRFALIVGALGVGIGIGLQDVVNNFVSGLILLFERPVQTGDTVQVGELFGEVRRIGMRSSTVRTWSGAEVIVPNSKLVSDNVVNWTLSDKMRRVEIPIGVAYGTDPHRVLALLVEVARGHDDVLDEPAPSALFQGHGNSSLDFELRAWTASPDWPVVRSDLNAAVNRALYEAGIEIPFPQRDLHLRSVDPKARDALRGPARE